MTNTAYKLTDRDGYTRRGQTGETLWGVGDTVRPTGQGSKECGPGVLHGYISPEVAVLGNPAHANIGNPRLFEIEADAPWQTDGLKRWTTGACIVVRELPLPTLTTEELVAWVICLASHASTREWAVGWLSGVDRSEAAALAARYERAAECEASRAALEAAWAASRAAALSESYARAAARTAEARASEADSRASYEHRLMPALERAREILAGTLPADKYDEDGEGDR